MIFVILAIVTVLMMLPLMYELPNFVYNRRYAILPPMRWNPVIYTVMFVLLTVLLFADGLVMIWLSSTVSFFSVRLWTGIIIGFIGIVYFIRVIPVYYDDRYDTRSSERAFYIFIRELVALLLFTVALFAVSVYVWSFILDAVIGAGLILLRLKRFLRVRRKK